MKLLWTLSFLRQPIVFLGLGWLLLGLCGCAAPRSGSADPVGRQVKILKVLPHYLDENGKHALSPSFLERDAYQALLRQNPDRVTGVRYDILWQIQAPSDEPWALSMSLRTASRPGEAPLTLEQPVSGAKRGRGWVAVQLDGDAYREAGEVIAWHLQVLDGELELASQRSFLW